MKKEIRDMGIDVSRWNQVNIERIVDLMEHIEKTEIDRNEVFKNEKGNQS